MQLNHLVTPKEENAYFEKCLKDAVELGSNPEKSQMFNANTLDDIFAVARSYPNTNPELIKTARENWRSYMAWRTR